MDQHNEQPSAKPEWALSRSERKRQALLAAGIQPRRFPWALAAGVVVLGGIAVLVVPQLASSQASPETSVAAAPVAPVAKEILNIDVSVAGVERLESSLKATGSLSPRRSVAITSQVSGTVEQIAVRVGDRVKAGDLLVQVDLEALSIQLRQQKATAAATRAQLGQAKSQLERSEGLAARGLTPRSTVESERSGIEALEANLEALESAVATAELAVRNATVRAPFDGAVAARGVEPGQVIAAGTALVEIVDLSTMEMTAFVPVSASPALRPGQRVSLAVEGLQGRVFEGAVEGISPVAAKGTRTVPVTVSIDNPDGVLRGGMFASGQIVTGEVPEALAVPSAAIREDADGKFVLAIVDGTLRRQQVVTAGTWNGKVELSSGLAAGTIFVSGQLDDLEAGMAVKVLGN